MINRSVLKLRYGVLTREKVFLIGVIFLLVACSHKTIEISSKPIAIQPTSDYKQDGITEIKYIEVRAFVKGNNSLEELSGATCEIKGEGYNAQLTSPSIVGVPIYGEKTSKVTMYCESDNLAGSGSVNVFHNHSNYSTVLVATLK